MSDYTESELAELRSALRAEVQAEMQAAERSQNGLVTFLRAVGLHVLARMVAGLTYSAWKQFRRLIGWG